MRCPKARGKGGGREREREQKGGDESKPLPALRERAQVLEGKGYGHECDTWSLGVCVFIALAGYPPFGGKNQQQVSSLRRSRDA